MNFMNTMNNNISFTSRIVPLTLTDFDKVTAKFDKEYLVDYPWTLNEAVVGKDVFTKNVCDCTCVVFKDGQKAGLLHLNPAKKVNHLIVPIIGFLQSNFNIGDKNLRAIVIGSKNTKPSQSLYNNLIGILTHFDIPFSVLKNGNGATNVAYRTDADEVLVSNLTISGALKNGNSAKEAVNSGFKHVLVSKNDVL